MQLIWLLTPAGPDRFCLDNLNSARDILSELEEERGMEIEWRVFAKGQNLRSQKKYICRHYGEEQITCS